MELSSEDVFRLNVLLANPVKAIRINESTLTLHALTEDGEAKVPLNPNCREDRYLRLVRELLSGHVMGSPGGYPVYLTRWTRMGQSRGENLEQLLLLGESEALVAVVCAPDITDEIASRAWWVEATSDNARRMLCAEAVIKGDMGQVLADHLAEHLAFENEPQVMIDTVSLILQPGLLPEETIAKVWEKAKKKPIYQVGFLKTLPDNLPESNVAHAQYTDYQDKLAALSQAGNPVAKMLLRVMSASGQSVLTITEAVLKKPNNQDVMNDLFDTLRFYFSVMQPETYSRTREPDLEAIIADVSAVIEAGEVDSVQAVLDVAPELKEYVTVMMQFSLFSYGVLRPIFSKTTAIGTLMRKKLLPVTDVVFAQLATLKAPIA